MHNHGTAGGPYQSLRLCPTAAGGCCSLAFRSARLHAQVNIMNDRLHCEYWLDPLCIWAFVGRDKLDRICGEQGERLDLCTRIVPIFGSLEHRFTQGRWSSEGVPGRVAATARIGRANGHPEVTGEVWAKDMPSTSWSPGAAFKAVQDMELRGEAKVGTAVAYLRVLQDRFFLANENIARRTVQLREAEALGIDCSRLVRRLDDGTALAQLHEDALDKERLSLRGSPSFVFDDGRTTLYGNFAYGVLRETIAELLAGGDTGATAC